ncbi:DUF1801 domain-containing protein [Sphingorhabdus sp. SMR4y]|uniref:DUF1801 domain-containing protein n=1 Tax=Sphingorhabdus sp. SMR4y TaxID=2584094 RepID=UPI000B61435B|nr:DUF1801 domain-containing protein [Sphingorhabdus sp. SMR4y]ASK89001.1 hypothetical protein SPHFLASMR4Y_02258 [Sphingorhabdus sp. SMR4y]
MTEDIPEPVRAAWKGLPEPLTVRLVQLRRLILDVASENPAIGPLEETLKWGEAAFLTSATGSGTTVRINRHKKSEAIYGLYVHCQTDLIARYRQLYDQELTFDGNRAVLFDCRNALPVDAARHCIAMALTYHLRRQS